LIDCLRPAVNILHVFSSVIGEAASLVSYTYLVPISCSSYGHFNAISPGSFLTGKSYLCWNRCSAHCTYNPERPSIGFPVTYGHGYGRLQVGSVQATMLSSTSLTALGISSTALIFIPAFRLPR
jgi:hypothetical protein